MASFENLENGRVRASVYVNGIRDSKTLSNKQKAKSWARDRESELSKQDGTIDCTKTFGDLFKRYADKISSQKEGAHWEQVRLNMFLKKYKALCNIKLVKSKREDLEDWVDLRIKNVKPSTVNRELNLISHTLTCARRWRWIAHNPMADLQRPKNPPARFRRISEREIKEICFVLGYREDTELTRKREFVAVAFLFAIETAMRAGEICSITRSNINRDARVAHLDKTKNGDQRDVPLSERALALLDRLPELTKDDEPVFQLKSGSLSTIFRTHRQKTDIQDLVFHDTRHEAITRLADHLHVLELAAVTGHRNLNELLTYYNKSAGDLAMKLGGNPVQESSILAGLDCTQLAKQLIQELAKVGRV